ncbi:MAG: hypothetical protein ACOC4G_01930 [Bacillota bacterium]
MNNFRETLRKKSTKELVNILREVEKDYGDDSLNAAREQTIKMIQKILEERGVDINNLEEEVETEEKTVAEDEDKKEDIEEQEPDLSSESDKEEVEINQAKDERKKRISVRNNKKNSSSDRKYKTLSFLSSFIKISSVIFFILVLIGNFLSGDGLFTSLVIVIISLVILIPYFALSELIYLFIDIEENTRKTQELLNRFYKGGQ